MEYVHKKSYGGTQLVAIQNAATRFTKVVMRRNVVKELTRLQDATMFL